MLRKVLSGVCAGLLITIGGSVYLACDDRYAGAVLFSVALLCICLKGYSLFTGKVGFMPEKHGKEEWSPLLLGLLGNLLGTVLGGLLIRCALPGLGAAAEAAYRDHAAEIDAMYARREQLVSGLRALPEVIINGPEGRACAPQVVSASFTGVRSEVLLHALEAEGICVSAGSACASNGQKHPSPTLTALHMRGDQMDGTIRKS